MAWDGVAHIESSTIRKKHCRNPHPINKGEDRRSWNTEEKKILKQKETQEQIISGLEKKKKGRMNLFVFYFAVTNYYRLGHLNNRNVLLYNSVG